MRLTSSDRALLHQASEVMLNPFSYPTAASYMAAVSCQVIPLLGGFAAICACRGPNDQMLTVSAQWPDPVIEAFARWKLADEGTRRAIALGMEVISMRRMVAGEWDLYNADPMVIDWYKPNGVADAVAYLLHWPEDDALATIEFHADTFGHRRFGPEGEALLDLLLPSLRAGTRLLFSLGAYRLRLARELDSLGLSVAVCARDGRIVHASLSLSKLFVAQQGAPSLREHVVDAARAAALGTRSQWQSSAVDATSSHVLIRTNAARYRISAALANRTMQFGDTDVLVTVSELDTNMLSAAGLMSRFALTKRESDVALLLITGARNDAIATQLSVSHHTVARHLESVFRKLGVTTRTEAAAVMHS